MLYPLTHIDHIAVIATLVGAAPVSVQRCRVLDLNAADGSNLASLASAFPRSQFVGLSSRRRGRPLAVEIVAALELRNVELVDDEVETWEGAAGEFDYIIARGLYSAVAERGRARLLELCRQHLAPSGVAYLSHDTMPGGGVLGQLRELVRLLTDPGASPSSAHARAILELIVRLTRSDGERDVAPYARALAERSRQLLALDRAAFTRALLGSARHGVYLRDFLVLAERHGLRYLTDAEHRAALAPSLAAQLTRELEQLSGEELAREQLLDFVTARATRHSLLCREELELVARRQSPEHAIDGMLVAARPRRDGLASTERNAWVDAAMVELHESWPRARPFPDVARAVVARLGLPTPEAAAARPVLARAFLERFRRGLVRLMTTQATLVRAPSHRPAISAFARFQAAHRGLVCTHHHTTLAARGRLACALAAQLDGERTSGELVELLWRRARAERWSSEGGALLTRASVADEVARLLEQLALAGAFIK